jgi:hypothetical protein
LCTLIILHLAFAEQSIFASIPFIVVYRAMCWVNGRAVPAVAASVRRRRVSDAVVASVHVPGGSRRALDALLVMYDVELV